MDARAIADRVIAIIAPEAKVRKEDITPSTSFAELGIDSLQGLSMIYELESELGLTLQDVNPAQINTVGDIIAVLTRAGQGTVVDNSTVES